MLRLAAVFGFVLVEPDRLCRFFAHLGFGQVQGHDDFAHDGLLAGKEYACFPMAATAVFSRFAECASKRFALQFLPPRKRRAQPGRASALGGISASNWNPSSYALFFHVVSNCRLACPY
jgi:hypothetical protein